eukprot:4712581-Amphidinium_carterae.1
MPFDDFFTLVLQLRGSNNATVKDIVDMRRFVVQDCTRSAARLSSSHDHANRTLKREREREKGRPTKAFQNIRIKTLVVTFLDP